MAWDELVKGYEYKKGRFLVLTREDFRAAALDKSRTVDIRSLARAKKAKTAARGKRTRAA